jgi:hypothetical protein
VESWGGAAAPLGKAATPNRAARMAGSLAASANPHDCEDDRISSARRNETRALSLMLALWVNSGTSGLLAGNRALFDLPRCLKRRPSF